MDAIIEAKVTVAFYEVWAAIYTKLGLVLPPQATERYAQSKELLEREGCPL